MVKVGGPNSELEAEASKKYISEKEIIKVLDNIDGYSKKELERVRNKARELVYFYDRIIRSLGINIRNIEKTKKLSYKEKKDKFLEKQEKDLSQAKRERSRIKRHLKILNEYLKD